MQPLHQPWQLLNVEVGRSRPRIQASGTAKKTASAPALIAASTWPQPPAGASSTGLLAGTGGTHSRPSS
eukprot:CAMPEP_0119382386 /NCGR_PEP_ID=MMETSP1334-20130426/72175_1 /TAXON_ID=127549 /ORGANISM="Calcidiscus leptoporus, Strain RCC1130" /LENGTH=68 /DNA_ID=CAMNT_0007402837 /DNA_START=8 /DNA_END=211 /DNA_ORIENTATION=+